MKENIQLFKEEILRNLKAKYGDKRQSEMCLDIPIKYWRMKDL